jgi:hypothetical protein
MLRRGNDYVLSCHCSSARLSSLNCFL